MKPQKPAVLRYRRCRFAAALPLGYLYTSSHFWLSPQPDGSWRVGMTKFGTRLNGETVELDFRILPGAPVAPGEVIGSLEGFKAVSDLVAAVQGTFLGGNPALTTDIALVNKDPHQGGWLYAVSGAPACVCLEARAYARQLDVVIDRMRSET